MPSQTIVGPECNATVISQTTAATIGSGVAGDCYLHGVLLTDALTGTCVITGFADAADNAQSITLPASAAAGFRDFRGAVNSKGALTFTCSNAGDDNKVIVFWRPR